MTPVQHLLVATDFGAASTRALEVSAEVAIRFGAKVTILHVIEDLSGAFQRSIPPEIRRAAAFRLDDAVKDFRRQVPAVEGILREGFAWHQIAEGAKDAGADLVVVGSHGDGDGRRFLIGSVAEKVVRVCAVPVLTVHAWRFEDRSQAGRELAEALLRSCEQAPTVVALSRGGAMVGAEVAEAFGAPLHVLLTRALRQDGRDLGAVCEDGTVYRDGRGAQTAGDRERFVERCRALGPVPVAVAAPLTDVALLGVVSASKERLIDPILVAPEGILRRLAGTLGPMDGLLQDLFEWPPSERSWSRTTSAKRLPAHSPWRSTSGRIWGPRSP